VDVASVLLELIFIRNGFTVLCVLFPAVNILSG